jgi:2-succinyl-6-hydroxy-2,4-cyclohexadiene-1-carboxylate synthase
MTLSSHAIGNGSPATFLHGFTQTSHSWSHLVEKLPFTSTLIDLPGHGDSPDGRRSLTQTAEEIADAMPAGCLIGYSMGARMALHTALQYPHKVSALVLVSGTAGIRDNDERTARRLSDIELATHIQELGVPAFIDEWLSQPLFAGLNSVTNQRADRLRNHAVGLADSLRFAGTGTQEPLWDQLHMLTMPVLLMCGTKDTKFHTIATEMGASIPSSTCVAIEGVGHTVHLEQPERFVDELLRFTATT